MNNDLSCPTVMINREGNYISINQISPDKNGHGNLEGLILDGPELQLSAKIINQAIEFGGWPVPAKVISATKSIAALGEIIAEQRNIDHQIGFGRISAFKHYYLVTDPPRTIEECQRICQPLPADVVLGIICPDLDLRLKDYLQFPTISFKTRSAFFNDNIGRPRINSPIQPISSWVENLMDDVVAASKAGQPFTHRGLSAAALWGAIKLRGWSVDTLLCQANDQARTLRTNIIQCLPLVQYYKSPVRLSIDELAHYSRSRMANDNCGRSRVGLIAANINSYDDIRFWEHICAKYHADLVVILCLSVNRNLVIASGPKIISLDEEANYHQHIRGHYEFS